MYEESLQHHGILGQKWGVRRFQRNDGSLTPEGKRRYADLDKAKTDYKKAKKDVMYYRNIGIYDKESEDKFNKASGMYDLRKKQVSDLKVKDKIQNRTKIGNHEQKLIDKYKEKGMSQEEAEIAAYKRARLEKTLAIAAGVTVAAATAYGAKKYHDYVSDEVLKVGKVSMKRVAASDTADVRDTFYAAFSKGDAKKYVGMYGTQLKEGGAKNIYQKTIDLKEDIKIASDKRAKQTMADVLSKASSDDKKEAIKLLEGNRLAFLMGGGVKQGATITKAIKDINAGKYDTKAVYDSLNMAFGDKGQTKVINDFKNAIKSAGYAGVRDRNDAKYSGYNADSARIIFDNSKVKVKDVRKVSDEEVNGTLMGVLLKFSMKQLAGYTAAGVAGANAYNKVTRTKENNKAIAEYKKEHPNTKLSNDEILENYYGGK